MNLQLYLLRMAVATTKILEMMGFAVVLSTEMKQIRNCPKLLRISLLCIDGSANYFYESRLHYLMVRSLNPQYLQSQVVTNLLRIF